MSEAAAFEARTTDATGRILFLNEPWAGAEELGLVLPRQTRAREGVVFDIAGTGSELVLRGSKGPQPSVTGARFMDSQTVGEVTAWRFAAESTELVMTDTRGEPVLLTRPHFPIGVGTDWSTGAHRALYAALQGDSVAGAAPSVWLGGAEQTPAVRILQGTGADLTGASLSFDPGHELFHDLPLESFDWAGQGRVLHAQPQDRALLIAVREGQAVGALILLRGNVLLFAGDPFSRAPIAAAALLLDNAIGVVAGTRPSERPGFGVADGSLPTRRQALAQPFEPRGGLDLSTDADKPSEFASWLLVAAALALAAAAGVTVNAGRSKSR
jgi:hypothetical protein